jgi:hypothetical protein
MFGGDVFEADYIALVVEWGDVFWFHASDGLGGGG